MYVRIYGMALVAALTIASTAAAASEGNGAPELRRGNYVAAERIITGQLRMWPGDTDLLLNLATVYGRTGRRSEARMLYRSVLARPDDVMDLQSNTSRSAHALAQAGLANIDRAQLSSR